jgi:hypothetical protein
MGIETIVIPLLVIFIVGLIIGVVLARPTHVHLPVHSHGTRKVRAAFARNDLMTVASSNMIYCLLVCRRTVRI